MRQNLALNFEAQRQYIIDKTNGKLEYRDMIYCPDCKRITKHYFMKELNKEICGFCYMKNKNEEQEKSITKEVNKGRVDRLEHINKSYLKNTLLFLIPIILIKRLMSLEPTTNRNLMR